MAELKSKEEYDLQGFPTEKTTQELVDDSTLEQLPKNMLKKISLAEKLTIALLFIIGMTLTIMIVQIRTDIIKISEEITQVEQKSNEAKKEKGTLEQEKNELSRADRVKKIAEEEGLNTDEKNIRKVSP